ncbi:serine/threonine-protein kinase [Paractinoplanes lichenicola]|uniref:non-specific serine/threonine protein kinase n=1 Tax=Paractinoplanes lichenicola TaxID=2802976 RepID=A0ABS1W0B0_9ACTN|nr:serine/threonine-protein kinase [Actinoplanes lichenicola]MBL7260176.1 serine/threonine protein kinase [Actinoplanes lichenicola]
MDRGQLIAGRYRLREVLGRGGMSVVWRAEDDVLGREVAVKMLSPKLAADPGQRRQIRDEARAVARLRHANVVAVYDYGDVVDDGRTLAYVVMELVDGRTLADMLTGGRLPWKVATLVGAQVAAALAAAHADGIVHRDVKPANVMVTGSGVKLVDFGISAAVGAFDDDNGQLVGTPAYLAPERIRGGPVRPATDMYALGLLMYLALAGQMPWDASTVTQMVRAHVYAKPRPLPPIAGLPLAVSRLVARCLAKTPGDRPSAIEVSEVLGEVAGLPSSALMRSVAAPTVTLPAVRTRRPRPAALIGAGALSGLIIAGGAWWVDRAPAEPARADAVATPSSSAPTVAPKPSPSTAKVVVTRVVSHKRSSRAGGKARKPAAPPAPKAKPGAPGKAPRPGPPGKK